MVRYGVHGKIPPLEVFSYIRCKAYRVGTAGVGIFPVYAVSCNFKGDAV